MTTPNLFLIYVSDVERATRFYSELFEMEPKIDAPRTSEVGLMVPGGGEKVDELFDSWVAKEVTVYQEPYDDVFGRTFMVTDPDGNLIRVSPTD